MQESYDPSRHSDKNKHWEYDGIVTTSWSHGYEEPSNGLRRTAGEITKEEFDLSVELWKNYWKIRALKEESEDRNKEKIKELEKNEKEVQEKINDINWAKS